MEAVHIQSNFTAGEWSPRMLGRTDLEKYGNACASIENFLIQRQGGAIRRPGTRYVAPAKTTAPIQLIPFQYSTEQTYMLEFGSGYVRFFSNSGQVVVSGVTAWSNATAYVVGDLASLAGVNYYCILANTNNTPPNATYWYPLTGNIYEIPSPYAGGAELTVKYNQSADILFLCHPSLPPYELQRQGPTDWVFVVHPTNDGPYLDINTTGNTLTPSASGALATAYNPATSYAIGDVVGYAGANYTATHITLGNPPTDTNHWGPPVPYATVTVTMELPVFVSTDVGRAIRFQSVSLWGWGIITVVTDSTHATVNVIVPFDAATGSINWRLGAWTPPLGYPSTSTFHQERLWFASSTAFPQTIWSSVSGDFANFQPSTTVPASGSIPASDTVSSDDAVVLTIDDTRVNQVSWMLSCAKGLILLTTGGEFLLGSNNQIDPITPTNVAVFRQSTMGILATARPVLVSVYALFVQFAGRKMEEMRFDFYTQQFLPTETTLMAEHITLSGVNQLAYQQEPQSVFWANLNNGSLIGFTYQRDEQVLAWHRHPLGGDDVFVSAIGVIRDPALAEDQLWLAVQRTIQGATVQYIEFLEQTFDLNTDPNDAFFVDSGLSFSGWNANPAEFLTVAGGSTWNAGDVGILTATGFTPFSIGSVGQEYRFTDLTGATPWVAVQVTAYTSSSVVAIQFLNPIPTALQGMPTANWCLTATKISGLDHLEGQTVALLVDGATHPEAMVATGTAALNSPGGIVQAGLPYTSLIQTVPLVVPTQGGTSQGRQQRPFKTYLRVNRTLGGNLSVNGEADEPINYREVTDLMDDGLPLVTGIIRINPTASWNNMIQIQVNQPDPLPMELLSITTFEQVTGPAT